MRCGLLGQTLAHSHSPLLHSLLGNYAYTLFEKAPDQVEDFLKNGSWDGLNVTIPYKKTAYALCDFLSPMGREAGSGAGRRRSRRHRMRHSAADGRRRHRAIPHGKAR